MFAFTSRVLHYSTQGSVAIPDGDFPGFALLCLGHIALRVTVVLYRDWRARRRGGRKTTKLNIPRATNSATAPVSLCASCAFAHNVRGYGPGEEIVVCGYAFPPRDILFAVRDCTDYKPKRERSGAEIALEDAVCSPPLELQAANFRVAVAARNGSRA